MLLFTNEFLHNLFPNLFTIYTAIKMACFVKQCKSHSGRKSDCKEEITFHRFPKHEAEKKKWLQLIGKPDATEYNRVCSKHFTSDCFKLKSANIKSRRRLKKNVYPSLFLPQNENSKMDKPSSKVNTRLQSQKKKQSPKVNSRLQSQKKEQSSKVDSRFQSQKKVSSSKVNCRLQSQKKSLNLTEASRACKKHDAIISKLQSQLRKAKEISQQREKKMYTLSKRRLRLIRRIKYLDNTLKNKSKEETMKTCTIEENIETDEEENYQTYYDEDEYFHEKEEYFDIKEEYLEIKEDFDIIKAKIEMHQKHEIEIYTNVEYLDDET